MLQELDQEAVTTRRLLERVPDDRLGWRPHPKARTLGELALHVAVVPGVVASFACDPSPVQVPKFDGDPAPASAAAWCRRSSRASPTPRSGSARSTTRHWKRIGGW